MKLQVSKYTATTMDKVCSFLVSFVNSLAGLEGYIHSFIHSMIINGLRETLGLYHKAEQIRDLFS